MSAAAPEDDGPEKGRLSLSRPSGLRMMSMYLNYEIHSEADLPRSSNVNVMRCDVVDLFAATPELISNPRRAKLLLLLVFNVA